MASTGVSMYLTREANAATLRQLAALAPGSTLVMTYVLPLEMIDAEDLPGLEASVRGARAAGTPFLSFFAPPDIVTMARDAGFKQAEAVSETVSPRAISRAARMGCGPRTESSCSSPPTDAAVGPASVEAAATDRRPNRQGPVQLAVTHEGWSAVSLTIGYTMSSRPPSIRMVWPVT